MKKESREVLMYGIATLLAIDAVLIISLISSLV